MHEIRLRKAWSKYVDGEPVAGRVEIPEVPASIVSGRLPCEVRYQRAFNRPTHLGASRVFLFVSGWLGELTRLSLNDHGLPVTEELTKIRVDITSLLRPHNELVVHLVSNQGQAPRLSGEVSLQIEEA